MPSDITVSLGLDQFLRVITTHRGTYDELLLSAPRAQSPAGTTVQNSLIVLNFFEGLILLFLSGLLVRELIFWGLCLGKVGSH